MDTPIRLLALIAVTGLAIWLQCFLSKAESRWPGLILPAISFICAFLMLFSIAAHNSMTAWEVFALLAGTFLLGNIPTLFFLAIYWACRGRKRRQRGLEKMNIQDLE